tara:strand:+ start:57 stop:323 length:267 start_codon:yes stop_codon:yes gene_type:complete
MSKKKSYMDIKNILNEGAFSNFLKGLTKGKKGLQRDIAKYEKELDKNIDEYNERQSKLENAIAKRYGKKVKLDRLSKKDVVKSAKIGR